MPIHRNGAPLSGGIQAGIQAGTAKISARRQAVRRIVASTPSGKRAQTQTLLLEAGRELFTEKGIGATSVGDICSHAGFTRGAFYSNFTDMDHFVHRLAVEQWSNMTEFVRSAFASALDAKEDDRVLSDEETEHALAELSNQLLEAMPVSRRYYLLLNEFVGYILRDENGAAPLRKSYEEFKASLRELLIAGLAAIGREPILTADDMIEVLLSAAERSMRVGLLNREENLNEQLERTLPILLTHLSRPTVGR